MLNKFLKYLLEINYSIFLKLKLFKVKGYSIYNFISKFKI